MYRFILCGLFWLCSPLSVLAHGMSEQQKLRMLGGSAFQYIWLGAEHMLTGYDHLLFLLGVIFFLTKFKDIIKFISAFTLGHSITLIFATYFGIQVNYWLIDALIALTVCYKGFDNNGGFQSYFSTKSPHLLWMVFSFGLIHGLGLSTRLQQLPLGEKGTNFFLRIISFNVGVELGQVVALSVMLLLLSEQRHRAYFKKFSKVANDGLILCGVLLFLMQMHGYLHFSNTEDFAFDEDSHAHAHEKMDYYSTKTQHENIE